MYITYILENLSVIFLEILFLRSIFLEVFLSYTRIQYNFYNIIFARADEKAARLSKDSGIV